MFSLNYYKKYLFTSGIIRSKELLDRWALSRTTDYTKFVILSHPRTGSTLLHTYLNSHFSIRSLGEMPREKYRSGQQEFILDEHAFYSRAPHVKAVGLKIFYKYEDHAYFEHVYKQVLEDKTIKVIHLVRQDFLALYLSLFKARESGHWSYTEDVDNKKKLFHIPLDHFIAERDKYANAVKHFDRIFSSHEKLDIDYENLNEQPETLLSDIQSFLKVDSRSLFSVLKKQGPIDYKLGIANIEELHGVITTDIK